jgi:hypothetical protein
MLVLSGTRALFPLIDDVFSPIIRQFKKINVGSFEATEETENCIRAAITSVGISNPLQVITGTAIKETSTIYQVADPMRFN